jgi:NADH:ubiquinone reductase (H+-translocating)
MFVSTKTKIVILGAGFGGFYAALEFEKTLKRRHDIEVILIDQENFFLFTPMLHEIAAGDLSSEDIVYPLRKSFKRVHFYKAKVDSIDFDNHKVYVHYGERKGELVVEYDHLIVSMGSTTNLTHLEGSHDEVFTMKTLGDAVALRNHIIAKLEEAELEPNIENKKAKLTFVGAGAGFAGVETVAAINDFVSESIKYYPSLSRQLLRIILVHPHAPILPEFDEHLGYYAQGKLCERGVEIITNTEVKHFAQDSVYLSNGMQIACDTLIWTAGIIPSSILHEANFAKEHGRIKANEYLQTEEKNNVWAVGDCAYIINTDTGKPYPPTAQHAMREGKLAAANILSTIDKKPLQAFRYKTLGQMAAIGNRTGVGDILGIKVEGLLGWFIWRTIYWCKLPGIDHKIRVAFNWWLDLIFPPDLVQYISRREKPALTRLSLSEPEAAAKALK